MSTISAPSKPKVYKKQGSTLSETAQYRAKLKSRVYNNPNKGNVGLDDSKASGVKAALLAAKADLSIHPYQRETSSDATTAALAVKSLVIPKKSPASPVSSPTKDSTYSLSSSAANNLMNRDNSRVTFNDTASVNTYSKNAAANAKVSTSTKSSSSLTSDSSYYVNAAKSSLYSPTKSSDKTSSITSMDYSKIQSRAVDAANDAINKRTTVTMNPSRYGLSGNLTSPSGSIDYSKLTQKASLNASNALKTPEDEEYNYLVSRSPITASASYAMKNSTLSASTVSSPTKSTYSKVDSSVLALARKNADATLKSIDKSNGESYLYSNADFNQKAMEIAKARHEERESGKRTGQYDLGGGLYMPVGDVEAIAKKNVSPILEEIHIKAEKQRKIDEEYAQEQERLRLEREAHEKELKAKKAEEKRIANQEYFAHRKLINEEKQRYSDKKKELEVVKGKEVATHKSILKEIEKKHQLTVAQLTKEKSVHDDKLYKELTEFKAGKQAELEELNEKFLKELQPIIDRLDEEKRLHLDLVNEQAQLEELNRVNEEKVKTAEELLKKSQQQLEKSEATLLKAEEDLSKTTEEAELVKVQASVNLAKADVEKKITQELESQADKKKALDKFEKSNAEAIKIQKEVELKDAAIEALEEEKKFATLKPGLNSEKIKALESEIQELDKKEGQYKLKEERAKYDAAIAEHEKTIKLLEAQKRELSDKEKQILAELENSDKTWKQLREKFDELNVDEEYEDDISDLESEYPLKDKLPETDNSHSETSVKATDRTTETEPVVTSPIKETSFTNTAVSSPTKSDGFLNKVVSNLTKTPRPTTSSASTSPVKRKRGFSLSNVFKKDTGASTSVHGTTTPSTEESLNKESPKKEVTKKESLVKTSMISEPKPVESEQAIEKGSIATNNVDSKESDDESEEEKEEGEGEINEHEDDVKYAFSNFTQGSEVDERAEMDKIFNRSMNNGEAIDQASKGKTFFTEEV